MSEPLTAADRGSFQRWLALGLALGITLIGGALYGSYSQRWGPPPDLASAAERLAQLPQQVASWHSVEELPMSEEALAMLESAGYINRRYVDQQSGAAISVAMIVGPPGPTAVHTPEICFSSRAFDIEGTRQRIELDGARTNGVAHSFWMVDFRTRSPLAESLRVYYAWSRGGAWEASPSPRYKYAALPYLYKIQLAVPLPPGSGEASTDAGRQFLEALSQSGWSPYDSN